MFKMLTELLETLDRSLETGSFSSPPENATNFLLPQSRQALNKPRQALDNSNLLSHFLSITTISLDPSSKLSIPSRYSPTAHSLPIAPTRHILRTPRAAFVLNRYQFLAILANEGILRKS